MEVKLPNLMITSKLTLKANLATKTNSNVMNPQLLNKNKSLKIKKC